MSGNKKRFTCGHLGFGRWCHACSTDGVSRGAPVHFPREKGWQGSGARKARGLPPRDGRS